MCGDVNLFFNDHEDRTVAEIEVMIAEHESRRKGLGREALLMFMHYGKGLILATSSTSSKPN